MKYNLNDFNWPGWPLKGNPYGKDFDLNARIRMVKGSELLFKLINKYKSKIGDSILEVGPFFNPLITPKNFPDKKIFYWENDYHVITFLKKNFSNRKVCPVFCDLNRINGDSLLKLKLETEKLVKENGIKEGIFDCVVVSHVFNYIDYKLFLISLREFVKKDCLLFLNNVVDYGLPTFFSERRPKSIPEILKSLKETGWEILEKEVISSQDKINQKNDRLILVVKIKK